MGTRGDSRVDSAPRPKYAALLKNQEKCRSAQEEKKECHTFLSAEEVVVATE